MTTLKELREKAKQLKIKGFSTMTKDKLTSIISKSSSASPPLLITEIPESPKPKPKSKPKKIKDVSLHKRLTENKDLYKSFFIGVTTNVEEYENLTNINIDIPPTRKNLWMCACGREVRRSYPS